MSEIKNNLQFKDDKLHLGDEVVMKKVSSIPVNQEDETGTIDVDANININGTVNTPAATQEVTDNPEFLQVTTDSEGKILEGIKKDGTKEINIPIKGYNEKYVTEVSDERKIINSIGATETTGYLEKDSNNDGVYVGYNTNLAKDSILGVFAVAMYKATSADIGSSFRFYIGTIDQRSWLLPRIEVTKEVKNVKDGILYFDFTKDKIVVKSDEVIFIYAHPTVAANNESSDKTVALLGANSAAVYTNDLLVAVRHIGSDIKMRLTVYSFESIFATNLECSEIKSTIDSTNTALVKKQDAIIVDVVTGEKYKIKIVNGVITPISLNYNTLLCIGNSFTSHPYDYVWPSHGRSMAASTDACMYPSHLANVIECQVDTSNWALERTLMESDFTVPNKDNPYDAVILQLGENIISTDTEEIYNTFVTAYRALKANWPAADIFAMFGKMYGKKTDAVCQCIEKAASDEGIPLIDCSFVSMNDHYQIKDYILDDNGNYVELADPVYYSHPTDVGMYNMANKLLEGMGFSIVQNREFNIIKNQSVGGTISSPCNYWISQGIVTVRCEANEGYEINSVTVETESGIIVEATKRIATYTVYTFVMPAENVIITPTWRQI